MNSQLFLLKNFEYFPLQFTEDEITKTTNSEWNTKFKDGKDMLSIETIAGTSTDNELNIHLHPWDDVNENKWIIHFNVKFIDDSIENELHISSGATSISPVTQSGETYYDISASGTNGSIKFEAFSGVEISLIRAVPSFPLYKKLDITSEIKVTNILKNFKDPFKNTSKFSKTFNVPFSKDLLDIFDIPLLSDFYSPTFYKERFKAQISVNSIEILFGEVYFSKVITNVDHLNFLELVFIGSEKTFLDDLKSMPLYLLDTATYLQQYADEIHDVYSNSLTGEQAKINNDAITFGFMEMGEDIESIEVKRALTHSFDVNNKTGYMADSFTPALWNWAVFNKIHENLGYSIDGNILDDQVFNNLVLPMVRKNWWELDDSLDINNSKVENWVIDNPGPAPFRGYYQDYSVSEINIFNELGSTVPDDSGKMKQVGAGDLYTRYSTTTEKLGIVRTTFDWSSLNINYTYSWDHDYYKAVNTYEFKFWVAQQIGKHNTVNDFVHTILDTVSVEVSSAAAPPIAFDMDNLNQKTAHYYKDDTASSTYFYITMRYVNGVNGENDSNHSLRLNIDSGSIVNTKVLTDVQGDYPDLSFDRFIGQQLGFFLLPKEKTAYDYIQDMVGMFNLVVDIDERTKTISYNKWAESISGNIIDLSHNLITNRIMERSSTSSLNLDIFSIKFSIDETDWLSYKYNKDYSIINPTWLIKQLGTNIDKINEHEITGKFYFDTQFEIGAIETGILTNFGMYEDNEENLKSDRVNYVWDKSFYAFANFTDTQGFYDLIINDIDMATTYSNEVLPMFSHFYNDGNIVETFKEIDDDSGVTIAPDSDFFKKYWNSILSRVTSNQQNFFKASFLIDAVLFNSLTFNNKFRIGNELFFIYKISDWNADLPTKIEFFKIYEDLL